MDYLSFFPSRVISHQGFTHKIDQVLIGPEKQ